MGIIFTSAAAFLTENNNIYVGVCIDTSASQPCVFTISEFKIICVYMIEIDERIKFYEDV